MSASRSGGIGDVGATVRDTAFTSGPPAPISVVGLMQIVFALGLDVLFEGPKFPLFTLAGIALVLAPTAWMMAGKARRRVRRAVVKRVPRRLHANPNGRYVLAACPQARGINEQPDHFVPQREEKISGRARFGNAEPYSLSDRGGAIQERVETMATHAGQKCQTIHGR